MRTGLIGVQSYNDSVLDECRQVDPMQKMTLVYWKDGDFWLGNLRESPETMTQVNTLEELGQ